MPPPAFVPPAWLRSGAAQTMWANSYPRAGAVRRIHAASSSTDLETTDGDHIRVHWNVSDDPTAPVLVILHGLTGCANTGHVLGPASKALAAGFGVVRVDLRNALGDTPSVGVGHAGRSEDLRTVLEHVVDRTPGRPVALMGYSLGGNILLKFLGEMDSDTAHVRAAVAISAPIDLDAACTAIDSRSNRIFLRYFLRRLVRRVRTRRQAGVAEYADVDPDGVRSLREFDGRVVARLCGFASAEDYYRRCSALPGLGNIRVPTLLVQAHDDPFIPFGSYRDPSIAENPYLTLLATERGGHAGFWARRGIDGDRFWAENRAIEFCRRCV